MKHKRICITTLAVFASTLCPSVAQNASYFFGVNPRDASDSYDGHFGTPDGFTTTGVNHAPVNSYYTSNPFSGEATVGETDIAGEFAGSLSITLGNVLAFLPSNEIIDSITMRMFINSSNYVMGSPELTVSVLEGIYSAATPTLNDLSPVLGSFTISSLDTGSWVEFDVPLSVLDTGFSLSVLAPGSAFSPSSSNFVLHDLENAALGTLPGFTVTTTIIPEPSVSLLGMAGVMGLLYRRNRRSASSGR